MGLKTTAPIERECTTYNDTFFPYGKVPTSNRENNVLEEWRSLHGVNKAIMCGVGLRRFRAW